VGIKVLFPLLPGHLRQNFTTLNKQQPVDKVARVMGDSICVVADLGNIKNAPRIAVW
jgi:hypothetical protein